MNKQFKKAVYLSIAVVVAIAIFDILAAWSGVFGTYDKYTNGDFTPLWWPLFFKMNLILLMIIPTCYYFFARKDLSESIALFLNGYILWFFALSDVLYFFLQGKMVPAVLPWLNGHLVIGTISSLLGSNEVTRTAVFISVIIGFIAIWGIDKTLEKIN